MGAIVVLTDVLTTFFGVIITALVGWVLWSIREFMSDTKKRLNSLEDELKGPAEITEGWKNKLIDSLAHDTRVIDLIMRYSSSGNPYDYNRKKELMEKYKNRTLTPEEAEELKKILEEDQKKAKENGDVLALLAIGLVLLVLIGLAQKK
ncbi:hypothetical protein B9Q11_00250 [Candidatus Marsarchaeota G2 archaeon ECH_B_SAG-F08]|uniref:Uncharacterized protein n=4 Tax=Candidatus Marsarchaeota TaxID=1978152 RepID=A0A2R6BNM1_9ARCH|nr:MAG: hypothetical protein B9Q01_04655 [Candidatus Marsarchaeota G1 archaeon OSP_D]PSN89001.1 MAG: hypothetical protein B9Q00_03300 [Candidatus Marsarchaeota G1 archaeon OSP_C]PSN93523.1 MAG: hypothetical protein B9P99_02335 [Candidatus Marsarchaeota G1 archaeon OSP_B]PSO00246.1 MAG: hypothetical protein B9Q11_00250 [Candidatus Marsarchaeota G2 archaeon ECH_B_SAG-F08]